MEIEFDPDKREKAMTERGLDFARAGEVRKANEREQSRYAQRLD
jgi:uncharacterized DUF497 family protein